MNDPRILIFDEATSALDVTVQKQIIELLQQLQKERKLAYLFICHNIALVQQFCDRVIVLRDGRIVESGLPTRSSCTRSRITPDGLSTLFSERQSLAVFPGTAQTYGSTDRLVRPPPR